MLPVCRLSDISASAGGSCGPGSHDVTSDACQPLQVIVRTPTLAQAHVHMCYTSDVQLTVVTSTS